MNKARREDFFLTFFKNYLFFKTGISEHLNSSCKVNKFTLLQKIAYFFGMVDKVGPFPVQDHQFFSKFYVPE